uniref:Uncharacterized protein n=1 Tax=Panagrolaimus davidi TaxID=227884 RepID=A0A914Q089_9BILA
MIAKELKKRNIQFYFIHFDTFQFTTLIVAANIELKIGESILIVKAAATDFEVVHEFQKSAEGYKCPFLKGKRIIECKSGYNPNAIKDDILAASNPKQIILALCSPSPTTLFKDLKNYILKSKKLIVFENIDQNCQYRAIFEIAEWICDRNYTKYFVYPDSFYDSFFVENEEELGKHSNEIYLFWNQRDGFLQPQTAFAPRSHKPYYIGYSPYDKEDNHTIIEHAEILKGKYHKLKLSLSVDINFFPSLTQKAYIEPEIEHLPKILDKKMDSKIPVIGFFDNSSIICFWNEKEKCYKFSEKWNGIYGKDLFMAFDKEKPMFFEEARESLKTHPSFVVYGNG